MAATPNPEPTFEPPVIEHTEWDDAPEKVLLFSISTPSDVEGEEPTIVEYTMPGKPHPGLALAFLRMARIYGTEMAMSWLLEEAVGTEGYLALAAEPDLTTEAMIGITRKVRAIVLGGLEAPKG